jgi:hypothetical protein
MSRPPTLPPLQTTSTARAPQTTFHPTAPMPVPTPAPAPPSRPRDESPPPAPPYSPITPAAIARHLATMQPYAAPSVLPAPPDPVPIADEADNTDVVALRSAVALLQLQREAARRDIRALDGMRRAALEDPEGYVRALLARARRPAAGGAGGAEAEAAAEDGDLLAPTIRHLQAALGEGAPRPPPTPPSAADDARAGAEDDEDDEAEDEDTAMPDAAASANEGASAADDARRFPAPPRAQNVYRMPPINWSKYRVVGAALDRLHEEQLARPAGGAPVVAPAPAVFPASDGLGGGAEGRGPRHELAAPYRPMVDAARLVPAAGAGGEHPMQTRRGARRVGG